MAAEEAVTYPTVTPYLLYQDVAAALDWLGRAFGFRERLRYAGEDGVVNHAEMTAGDDGVIMLGWPGPEYRNPQHTGAVSVFVHVLVDDVDTHCAGAREAGATILREPADEEYGDRRYDVADLEGHRWSFAQHIRDTQPADWGATTPR